MKTRTDRRPQGSIYLATRLATAEQLALDRAFAVGTNARHERIDLSSRIVHTGSTRKESKIVLVAVIVYFLLLYNTLDGIRDIEGELVESLQVMGVTSTEIASRVMIPGATPWIFTGLRVSVRYAFTAAILGELVAGNEGIGFLIEFSAGQFNSAGVFAAVFVLVLCSVLLTELLTRTETSALRWRI